MLWETPLISRWLDGIAKLKRMIARCIAERLLCLRPYSSVKHSHAMLNAKVPANRR